MGFGKTLGQLVQQQAGIEALTAKPRTSGRRKRGEHRRKARVEKLEARCLLSGNADSLGTDFWVAFEPNFPADTTVKSLFFSSSATTETQVTVDIPGIGWMQDCIVKPGEMTTIDVPKDAFASSSDGVSNVGIHVTSDQEIALYGMNRAPSSSDGFTAIPVDMLGTSYMVLAYTPNMNLGSELAVVATEDGTSVAITPKVNAGTHMAGTPYVVTLNRGEVYQLQSRAAGPDGDLTGSRITADRPVAVFGGNPITHVPYPYAAEDHLVEQLVPTTTWGNHFVTVPLAARVKGDVFRVLAAEDGTEVRVNHALVATLSAGQYYEWLSKVAQEISTSKPVTTAQYATCISFDNTEGDPFMAIIQPAEWSLTHYTMSAPATQFHSHYINFWTVAGTTVLLDGVAIPDSDFIPISDSGYVGLSRKVDAGTHVVSASAPVGMMVYGLGPGADSYGWIGGLGFALPGPGGPGSPVAGDQSLIVRYETQYAGAVTATDPEGHGLVYNPSTPPKHGELVLQADGGFSYVPDAGYVGPDLFRFWANAGPIVSNLGTVSIAVLQPNHPPVIADQSFFVEEHSAMYAPVALVAADDPDPDGDILHFAIMGGDPNGVFTIDAGTGLIQVARPEYLDYETMPRRYDLTVQVTDTGIPSLSSQATVTINVMDIDESRIGFTLSSTSIPEHRPAGTVVGDLVASNPDAQSNMVYTLVSGPGANDNATFAIVDQKLVANVSFDYEVRNNYRVRIRGTDGMTVFIEKAFAISVANINEAPAAIELSSLSVPEDQVIGTVVGYLSASSAIPDDVFTFSLVDGDGSESNRCFQIEGNRLLTAATFSYSSGLKYGIRVGVTNSLSLNVARSFVIGVVPLSEFGKVEDKSKSLTIREADGDMVTFKLSGGGLGALNGSQVSLTGTTAKSVLSISVKKNRSGGDGLYTITGLAADGLLKGINGTAVVLSGPVQVNTLNQAAGAGKAAVSLSFRQISDAEICVHGLLASSIAVSGDVSDSRIVSSGSISRFSAAALLDSDILVGVAADFDGFCAESAGDFANAAAKLGSLSVTGKKLPKGQAAPAYVASSHISAPSVGTVTLSNVAVGPDSVVHVLNDAGVLKVSQSKLTSTALFESGTWKLAGARPVIWDVVG